MTDFQSAVDRLTNLWWLKRALLQLFLQLRQGCVRYQLLEHKGKSNGFHLEKTKTMMT